MAFEITPDVKVKRDSKGIVRRLNHPRQPYTAQRAAAAVAGLGTPETVTPRALADQYVREVLPAYQLDLEMAVNLAAPIAGAITGEGPRLKIFAEKILGGQATISYAQTCLGLPVWEAGLTVQLRGSPARVTASQSSIHHGLEVEPPKEDAPFLPEGVDEETLARLLGLEPPDERPAISSKRLIIYAYDAADRGNAAGERDQDDEEQMHIAAPTLALSDVPDSIQPDRHYVVTEVLFNLQRPNVGPVNWGAFIEPQTGAVLRLDVFVGCVNGQVYLQDPLTKTGDGAITPASPAADLDPLRDEVLLEGLTPPPSPANPQRLQGEFVRVVNIAPPNSAPPSETAPDDFSYAVRTDDFAAVNAYYHCDRLFRMIEEMGFNVNDYFDGTTFPVRVDHRFPYQNFQGVLTGNVVNATAPGNAFRNGSDGFRFALVQRNTPVGMATEWRVVLHEFGHAILWDHLNSPNFRFAHSPGDSLAAILNDPDSNAPDRGLTFPWTPIRRRHDRPSATGWAWGGIRDDRFPVGDPRSRDRAGYEREQILSSTLFRLYRAIGGAHDDLAVRRSAARYTAFLIFSAVAAMSPFAGPRDAEDFADDLMDADLNTINFEGQPGGAVHKVIRWAFEQQGAYQPAGAPSPVTTPGAPPADDVYLDDGRNGEYTPAAEFAAASQDIWNRRNADDGLMHEPPRAGQPNFLYARVRNRGTSSARSVAGRAFHSAPGSNRTWPADWELLSSASLAGSIPSGGEAIIGPFEWVPELAGNQAVLVSVSARDDPSNLDSINQPSAVERLLHCDNNAALREVTLSPRITAEGVVNAASFQGGNVCPGEILTIFGSALGSPDGIGLSIDANGDVATQLGPTRVLVDGRPAAMVFAQRNQVSVVAPFSLTAAAGATIEVEVDGNMSDAVVVPVAATRPGLFSLTQTGTGQGAILNQDSSVNGAQNAAARGSVIQIFATGGGQTAPAAQDGRLAPIPPPTHDLASQVRVEFGGIDAQIQFAGAAPDLIFGVVQINAVVPQVVPPGDAVALQVFIDNTPSQGGITVAVS